jgi:prevent-host-death family protein
LTDINLDVNVNVKENSMGRIKSIGMSEARPKLTQIVDDVSNGGDPYLIVSDSRVKAVLIGIDRYNDMVARLEDLSDSAELLQAELEDEPVMSFEEHLQKSGGLKNGVPAGN